MNTIIIGASQGLGLCLTRACLENGNKVAAGTAQTAMPPSLQSLKERFGEQFLIFPSDVTQEAQIVAGAKACHAFFGEADALCNAAGVLLPSDRANKIHECDPDDLRRTLDVNVIGTVLVCKHFYPIMKRGAGVFTVTSEGVGVGNCGTWVPCYGLSKTAQTKAVGLFNAAIEDVDFYAVHPGRMNTQMGRTTAQIEPEESAKGFYALMTGATPVSRAQWYIDYHGAPLEC